MKFWKVITTSSFTTSTTIIRHLVVLSCIFNPPNLLYIISYKNKLNNPNNYLQHLPPLAV